MYQNRPPFETDKMPCLILTASDYVNYLTKCLKDAYAEFGEPEKLIVQANSFTPSREPMRLPMANLVVTAGNKVEYYYDVDISKFTDLNVWSSCPDVKNLRIEFSDAVRIFLTVAGFDIVVESTAFGKLTNLLHCEFMSNDRTIVTITPSKSNKKSLNWEEIPVEDTRSNTEHTLDNERINTLNEFASKLEAFDTEGHKVLPEEASTVTKSREEIVKELDDNIDMLKNMIAQGKDAQGNDLVPEPEPEVPEEPVVLDAKTEKTLNIFDGSKILEEVLRH